jgi:hypothetical protein
MSEPTDPARANGDIHPDGVRDATRVDVQSLPNAAKLDVATAAMEGLPDAATAGVVASALQTLPDAATAGVVTSAMQALPDEAKASVAAAAIHALPAGAKADATTAAVRALSNDAQDDLIERFAPDQAMTNDIWRWIVRTFAIVLGGAMVALVAAVFVSFWREVDTALVQMLLTIFTTTAGILAGFVSGRASAPRTRRV